MQSEIKTLFSNEPDLIKGFEEFLPINAVEKAEDKIGEGAAVQ